MPAGAAPRGALPRDLPLLRLRFTLRLLEATTLPSYKGALLRGGFGYAFQRAACPPACWGASAQCAVAALCPYRWVFETPHPPDVAQFHDLHDVPRPFVIEPPLDQQRQYAAGDALEFGVVLIGHGVDHLPYFLYAFEQLGRMGLGRDRARFRLERVEALQPWQPVGMVIYQDGRVTGSTTNRKPRTNQTAAALPLYDAATITVRAATLPDDLRLTLPTPLRVKARGDYLRALDLPPLCKACAGGSTRWRRSTAQGRGTWITARWSRRPSR